MPRRRRRQRQTERQRESDRKMASAPRVNASVICEPPTPHGECFSVKFQHDMSMLGAGYADGTVQVYDPNTASGTGV